MTTLDLRSLEDTAAYHLPDDQVWHVQHYMCWLTGWVAFRLVEREREYPYDEYYELDTVSLTIDRDEPMPTPTADDYRQAEDFAIGLAIEKLGINVK